LDAFLGRHLLQTTPIQDRAIETIYDGADVILVAPTASGKTEAAMIPIAARLLSDASAIALYIAPTRALLNDLQRRLVSPLAQLGLQSVVRHGDYALPADTSSIRVVFTTPESLDVMLSKKTALLQKVRFVILDEVHQIFGTPRGDQLSFVLLRLDSAVGKQIQRVALSATVGNPDEVSRWLSPQGTGARVITALGGRQIVGNVHWMSDLHQLREWLVEENNAKVLYFVNSRRHCDDVYLALRNLEPYQAFVHYGTLNKEQREYVERGFKSAQMALCVATTTLELGIDIGSIQEVVLVDPPQTVSSFLQRIGRGGRRGPSTFVTMTPTNPVELLQCAALVRLGESGHVESGGVDQPYSVIIQQIFSIIAGKRRLNLHPDEITEQFGALGWLSAEDVNAILERLVEEAFLRRAGSSRIFEVGPKLEQLIEKNEIFSNITDQGNGIPTFHEGRFLAHLPLNTGQVKHGNVILFAGRFWKIASVSDRGLTVHSTHAVPNPIRPTWSSKGSFATSAVLAQGMREVLYSKPDFKNHQLDAEGRAQLEELYQRCARTAQAGDSMWFDVIGDKLIYYTFAGALENQILQLLFAERGVHCSSAPRAEGIALISKDHLDFGAVPKDIDQVIHLISVNWSRLKAWATHGPFFELLPTDLKRREVVAQVLPAAHSITDMAGLGAINIDLGLVR